MFGQTFDTPDLAIIGLLIVLEGVLSIDNALVLGLLAKRLPKRLQKRALTYGLIGAFVFRVVAIFTASLLLKWWWVKLLGGGYLIYVAVKHFFFDHKDTEGVHIGPDGHPILHDDHGAPLSGTEERSELAERSTIAATGARVVKHPGFWSTIVVIELTDIAFAVDSILAAIAMIPAVPPSQTNPKLWVVITGGMLGVVLMRFAAVVFIKMLERFPRLEVSAYLLVIVIGLKLVVDWFFNKPPTEPVKDWHAPLNFHSVTSPAFWVFWVAMLTCFAIGFIPKKNKPGPGFPVQPTTGAS